MVRQSFRWPGGSTSTRATATLGLGLILTLVSQIAPLEAQSRRTNLTIQNDRFLINGTVTNQGTPAEGLLLNSRMVQAIFDDENGSTVGRSAYPDTGKWDPERNVREFIAALPLYAARGLGAVTVNLQGGSPGWAKGNNQSGIVTAFGSDGTLKAAWLNRLDRVIRAADEHGIVVIVGLFYFGQDHRLANESAIVKGVDGVTDWLVAQGYTNVLVEVNNEADLFYNHSILQPGRVAELITRMRSRSGGKLKVTTSLQGGAIPPSSVLNASDYILLHGNGQSASDIGRMVDQVRGSSAYKANPRPIVFNEDSTSTSNLDAAVGKKASWGYYDQGSNDYVKGYQSPPVNWTINTSDKQRFFDRVASLTGSSGPAPPPPPPPAPTPPVVTHFTLMNADTDKSVSGFDTLTNKVTLNLADLPTRNLALRVNTSPASVGSVRFGLNGNGSYLVDNSTPYALPADSSGNYLPWNLGVGSHNVTATAFSGQNAGGTASATISLTITIVDNPTTPVDTTPPVVSVVFTPSTGLGEVRATDASPIVQAEIRRNGTLVAHGSSVPLKFTIAMSSLAAGDYVLEGLVTDAAGNTGRGTATFTIDPPSPPPSNETIVSSFTLMNADTDQPVPGYENLTGPVTLNLGQLPTRNLNLRANTAPTSVGSVRFDVNGHKSFVVENVAPYSLGDADGDYAPWTLDAGTHVVVATPFSSRHAAGVAGTPLTINVTIVEDAKVLPPKPPTNVRIIR